MGLAVYNSIILDIHFPPVCYRKLLSPAVVPYNMPKATVGVTKVTLNDLSHVFPVSLRLSYTWLLHSGIDLAAQGKQIESTKMWF